MVIINPLKNLAIYTDKVNVLSFIGEKYKAKIHRMDLSPFGRTFKLRHLIITAGKSIRFSRIVKFGYKIL